MSDSMENTSPHEDEGREVDDNKETSGASDGSSESGDKDVSEGITHALETHDFENETQESDDGSTSGEITHALETAENTEKTHEYNNVNVSEEITRILEGRTDDYSNGSEDILATHVEEPTTEAPEAVETTEELAGEEQSAPIEAEEAQASGEPETAEGSVEISTVSVEIEAAADTENSEPTGEPITQLPEAVTNNVEELAAEMPVAPIEAEEVPASGEPEIVEEPVSQNLEDAANQVEELAAEVPIAPVETEEAQANGKPETAEAPAAEAEEPALESVAEMPVAPIEAEEVPASGELEINTEQILSDRYAGIVDIASRFINKADEGGYSKKWGKIENVQDKTVERLLEKTNPNFDANNPCYSFNCQRCVPTYEMRCRGFDVEAKPVERDRDFLSYHPYAVWENPEVHNISSGSGENEIRTQMAQWGDGARCQICVIWDPNKTPIGGGHTFVAEQVDGETHFYDPQDNNLDAQDYFQDCKEGCTSFCRIDNQKPSGRIFSACESPKIEEKGENQDEIIDVFKQDGNIEEKINGPPTYEEYIVLDLGDTDELTVAEIEPADESDVASTAPTESSERGIEEYETIHIAEVHSSELPDNVQRSLSNYKSEGWPNVRRLDCQEGRRTKADGPWHNRNGDLPTLDSEGNSITYREHDVNDCIDGERRDSERFVTGSDGSVYYTNDHYTTFRKIIGE